MQLEIRDDYDREAVAAILRALDPEAIMRGASTSGIVHHEVKARGRRMIDALRQELLASVAAADSLAHSRRQ